MFHLTITADDVDRFIDRPRTRGDALRLGPRRTTLGGRRPVEGGHFNLFVDQNGDSKHKRMYYRLHFNDGAGHPLTLVGHKEVRDERGLRRLVRHLDALHAHAGRPRRRRARSPRRELIATGILHILPRDFARQMTTFRVRPAHRVDAIGRFGAVFAGQLWKVYGGRAGR